MMCKVLFCFGAPLIFEPRCAHPDDKIEACVVANGIKTLLTRVLISVRFPYMQVCDALFGIRLIRQISL